jgi:biopolymer transport protein ExbD
MGLMGDIDGDGKVDASDLALLKQVLQEQGLSHDLLESLPPEDRARLDVNHDGKIDYEDVVRLSQALLQESGGNAQAMADKFMALRNKARH